MDSRVIAGNSLAVLKEFPDNTFDSVVTDPPYELVSGKGGFMGMKWDATGIAFNVQLWSEVLRVMKPGGHLLAFGGTRTYHRMACAIEDAGFCLRDCLMWMFSSGFPKNHDLGNGWGTSLAPAYEPICLARKPISESTIAKNFSRWGTGGIDINGCRLDTKAESSTDNRTEKTNSVYGKYNPCDYDGSLGRWPKNVLFDEDASKCLCENKRYFYCAKASTEEREAGLENFEPKKVNDGRQSAIDNPYQRGESLRKNTHPTVKPLELMEWLVKLVTPKGGIVLDPFCGSGSTLIAAKILGNKYIGIDLSDEYVAIAKARLEHYSEVFTFSDLFGD